MFSVTKIDNSIKNIKEFMADVVTDVAKLPTITNFGTQSIAEDKDIGNNDKVDAGSTCFVTSTSTLHILGNDNIWHQI